MVVNKDQIVRIEKHRTSSGKEFQIARKSRPSRRCQTPQFTGEKLDCPYCGGIDDVTSYKVRRGQKGERTLKSWICPTVGKMPLNMSKKFQDYIERNIIRSEPKSEGKAALKGQKKVRTKPDRPTGEMSSVHEYGKKKGIFRPETLGEYLKYHPVEEIIRRRRRPGRRGR